MGEIGQKDLAGQPDFEHTHSLELGRALAQSSTSRLAVLLEGVRRRIGERVDVPNFRSTESHETTFPDLTGTDSFSLVTDEYLFTMFPTSFADETVVFLEAWSGQSSHRDNTYDTSLVSKFQAAKRILQRGYARIPGKTGSEIPVQFCTVSLVPRERVNLVLYQEDPQRWKAEVGKQRSIRDRQWDVQFGSTKHEPICIRFYQDPHRRDAHAQNMARIRLIDGAVRITGEVYELTGGSYKNINGILRREKADNWDLPAPQPVPYFDFVRNVLGKFPSNILGI